MLKLGGVLLAGALLGLGIGWRCWGAGPTPTLVARVDTVLAAGPGEQRVRDSLLRILKYRNIDIAKVGTAEADARLEAQRSAQLQAQLDVQMSAAESLPVAIALVSSLTLQRDSLTVALDTAHAAARELASAIAAYATRAESRIDSLESVLHDVRRPLAAAARPKRWAMGPVFSLTGKPKGGALSRDVAFLRLTAQLTREDTRDRQGRPTTETRGALIAQVRF